MAALPRKKISTIWQCFDAADDNKVACRLCKQTLAYNHSTGAMRNHIHSRHLDVDLQGEDAPSSCEDSLRPELLKKRHGTKKIKTIPTTPTTFPLSEAAMAMSVRCCFNRNSQELLSFIRSYRPRNRDVSHLRILLHGMVGAGKSSFINSVDSALRGHITNRALTDANSGSSFTLTYKTYKIEKDAQSSYSVVFNNIMGFEENTNNGVQVEDVILAMKGHVKENYKFNPLSPLTQGDPSFNSNPSVDDKAHVLVCVVPAGSVALLSQAKVQKLRQVRVAASELGIPQVAILTKVDEACPEVKKDINNIYKSKFLKEQVEKFSMLLVIPINCIFLMKNSESEIYTSEEINRPILTALKQMVTYGDDFTVDLKCERKQLKRKHSNNEGNAETNKKT
ncbi:interferon-induced protein 44-like [Halichoeres trimaculatus]|uniref:interferon-induced protein 44-like n=1 Tax=Halichoeres trimaculatus TaxID=147232 RepID=UPI003D9F8E77